MKAWQRTTFIADKCTRTRLVQKFSLKITLLGDIFDSYHDNLITCVELVRNNCSLHSIYNQSASLSVKGRA